VDHWNTKYIIIIIIIIIMKFKSYVRYRFTQKSVGLQSADLHTI